MIPHDGGRPSPEQDIQPLIDRLVEGELDAATRRALLLRLEAEPGGWRRCAMAFLEAQSWREGLGELARAAVMAPATPRITGPPRRSRLRARLAHAAALLACFGLGWLARRSAEVEVAPVASRPLRVAAPPGAVPASAPAVAQNPAATREAEPLPSMSPAEPPVARLVASSASAPPEPVPASLLTSVIRGQLERRGYQVEQRPVMAAVRLDDGRRVAIPVEELKLRFVGARTY